MLTKDVIKKIIEEEVAYLLCEINIDVQDEKKRGYGESLGKLYYNSLKSLSPLKIIGKLGLSGIHGEISKFDVELQNGDKISVMRNVNPAFAIIYVNGKQIKEIKSQELMSNKLPDLVSKYYLDFKA